jgi:PST family polysaccharide transporter
LKIASAIAPLVIAGYLIGLPYGPRGVALGFSLAMTLWVVPHLLWCFHGTPVSHRDVLHVVSRPLVSGMVGAAAAYGTTLVLAPSLSAFGRLLMGSTVLFAVYGWMLLFVMAQKPLYLELFRSLKAQSSPQTATSV